MKLVIDDKIPFIRGAAERLGEVVYLPGKSITRADVADADALIVRTRTRCDEALLSGCRVKFIATATIGYDHLDTEYLAKAGICWTNCPGCNAASVAQYVEAALLLLAGAGCIDLKQCTVGVIGVGHVGSRVAQMAQRLGCRLLLCDPPRAERGEAGFVALEVLEREADVLTFHTPLSTSGTHPTFHLADEAFFARLKRTPVIINTSRGEVVSNAALLDAIRKLLVGAVIIDTWENEPNISLPLLEKCFLATPHIAGYSADGKANATRMALESVARFFGKDEAFSILPPSLPGNFNYLDTYVCPEDSPLRLYNPLRDTAALRSCPGDFERLRGDYPLRRES